MNADLNKTQDQQQAPAQPAADDDFFSDAPLAACPLRKDGMAEGEICEACQ